MAEAESNQLGQQEVMALTTEIVSAYVTCHTVAFADLPNLITTVGQQLVSLGQKPAEMEEEKPTPAVPIKKSVTPGYIVCLEDGKKLKMLKRHLKTRYEMTPDEYRKRWGLKDDYPMVAPDYAATRSELAKKIGLGRKPEPEPKPVAKTARAPRKSPVKKPAAKKRAPRSA